MSCAKKIYTRKQLYTDTKYNNSSEGITQFQEFSERLRPFVHLYFPVIFLVIYLFYTQNTSNNKRPGESLVKLYMQT